MEYNIGSSKNDDDILTRASELGYEKVKNDYICEIPDNWDIVCGTKKIYFKDIRDELVKNGMFPSLVNDFYGGSNCIITDAYNIYLEIHDGDTTIRKPLFFGEIKKQGTNDKRLAEGKDKQAIGNVAPDRVAKNFQIAAVYSRACDSEFFPYNVFLHGCDFEKDLITSTTISKLIPFFGKLNRLSPFFNREMMVHLNTLTGGSCFYQGKEFTIEQLTEIVYKCCELGIKHYLKKFC